MGSREVMQERLVIRCRWAAPVGAGAALLALAALGAIQPWDPAPAVAGEARLLLETEYPRAALEAITRATATVDVAMYLLIVPPDRAEDPVAALVAALVEAARRGVQVTVVVEEARRAENAVAVERLRRGGVLVQRGPPSRLLHAKALVVDERWVLLGSANWSAAAFARNAETSVWLDDPPLAQTLARAIRRWGAGPTPSRVPGGPPGVAVPRDWLLAGGPLARMVRDRAEGAFRVTLALLRDGAAPATPEAWSPSWREWGVTNARTQRKLRRRLQQDGVIGGGPSAIADPVWLPTDFWAFGYARALSIRAQLLWLVALDEAARSTRNPCWFRSQADLARATGLSDVTVGLGLLELERANLLEVHRAESSTADPADRLANQYCVNPLVDPAAREAALAELTAAFPEATLRLARRIAASLNEPNDPAWMAALARAIQRHGAAAVRRAHRQTLRRKAGSPGRTPAALLRLLTTPGEPV